MEGAQSYSRIPERLVRKEMGAQFPPPRSRRRVTSKLAIGSDRGRKRDRLHTAYSSIHSEALPHGDRRDVTTSQITLRNIEPGEAR